MWRQLKLHRARGVHAAKLIPHIWARHLHVIELMEAPMAVSREIRTLAEEARSRVGKQ